MAALDRRPAGPSRSGAGSHQPIRGAQGRRTPTLLMLSCVGADGESKPPAIAAGVRSPAVPAAPRRTGRPGRAGRPTRSRRDERLSDDRSPRDPTSRPGAIAARIPPPDPVRRGATAGPRPLVVGLLIGALIAAMPRPAGAWGRLGHRASARLAESRLSPRARAVIRDLLEPGESLADASTWADEHGRDDPRLRRLALRQRADLRPPLR